jgi:uncharacterized membrane protein
MVKEMSYHHGRKSGSLLWQREVILRPSNVEAIQDTRQAHLRLETRQAQGWKRVRLRAGNVSGSYQMVKEESYHHGSKSSSLLGLSEVILWPGSLAALQGTRQAHLRLETRQARGWKRVRLRSKW